VLSVRDLRELGCETQAMAARIQMRVVHSGDTTDVEQQAQDALAVFHEVDRTCTRFDPTSDLMRANDAADRWVAVSPYCFDALAESRAAYGRTGGRFDPRVLRDLVRLGYDRSLRVGPPSARSATVLTPRAPLPTWRPEFRRASWQVRLGPVPVDLGGIGKGLAVRWAAAKLRKVDGYLLDAGGDCACKGVAPDGGPWRIGIEDPRDPARTIAVLSVYDGAVATSSVRIRSWDIDGHAVHHLIDPLTGLPGGEGLLAVTVVDSDPAVAEVWSKVLFLVGSRGVRASAEHYGLAALWVDESGSLAWSKAAEHLLTWTVVS
jgi:thiamine biosynthesis lipoprotein